jgi:predicted transcriptional regulator
MIADILKKPESLSPDETVGKAAAKLAICLGLPVMDKSYLGMIYLRNLVVRDSDSSAKIGPLVKNPQKIQVNADLEEIMTAFMDYPVLPVFEKDLYIGTITRYDFVKTLKLRGKACEFAAETKILSSKSDIGEARNALKSFEVALVKEGDKVIGAVDVFSLARQISPKKHKEFTTDKIAENTIGIDSVMTKAVEIDMDLDIHKALELLKANSFLVCQDYIVTTRTILASIRSEKGEKEKRGVLELVGFDMVESDGSKVNSFDASQIIKDIENFAARTEKRMKPTEIKFNLQVAEKGGKDLYEIYAKVMIGGQAVTAHIQSLELLNSVQDIIEKLDIQLEKIKESDEKNIRNLKRHAGRDEAL